MKSSTAAIPLAAALLTLGACGLGSEEPDTEAPADTATADEAAEEAADETADGPDGEAEVEPAGERGSRANPLALGESIEGSDWVVIINEVQFGADEQVAAENQFNEPPPEGHSFVLIDVSATYTGTDSEMPMLGTDIAWVTSSGETLGSSDAFAVAPDAFDTTRELYEGGSETGNLVIAVPEDDEGLIRVRLGMFEREEAFVAPR
ncbi:hypothetical protein [Bogoriella caseilytica]|uniref:DUF4352 domain-containing protein n=1 Tax=Bogoriella caseilytica TaxID=56055 RepID=A0A3N2B9W9_9MICO|nr:hypothetical protein [Bogoriella caseilytica]ROR72051.1 hypothetical protein EDD31_0397 [Bogoriella caseilytica]